MNLSETADRLREYDKILAQRDELQKEHVELSCEIQRGLQRFADMTKQRDELRDALADMVTIARTFRNVALCYHYWGDLDDAAMAQAEKALSRCAAPEAPSVDGPTAAQADEILGKPHYSAQPKGRWD